MLEYKTTSIVRFNGGIIGLSKKQADARRHLIRPVEEKTGAYQIKRPVELKAGEVIRLESPGKALLAKLELTPAEQSRQAAAEEKARLEAKQAEAKRLAEAERHGAVIAAARQALKDGLVIKSGAPDLEAMESIASLNITASERDLAWKEIQAETGTEDQE